jgi:hypothetical protein
MYQSILTHTTNGEKVFSTQLLFTLSAYTALGSLILIFHRNLMVMAMFNVMTPGCRKNGTLLGLLFYTEMVTTSLSKMLITDLCWCYHLKTGATSPCGGIIRQTDVFTAAGKDVWPLYFSPFPLVTFPCCFLQYNTMQNGRLLGNTCNTFLRLLSH